MRERQLDARVLPASSALDVRAAGRLDLARSAFHPLEVNGRLLRPKALSPKLSAHGVAVSLKLDGPLARPVVDYALDAATDGVDKTVTEALHASGTERVRRGPRPEAPLYGRELWRRYRRHGRRGAFPRTRLEISRLTGATGKGTVSGSGDVDLSAADGFPLNLKVVMSQAQLVHTEDVSATVSGMLAITNDRAKGARISGDLTGDKVRYEVVRQGSDDVVELTGARRRGAAPAKAPAAAAAGPPRA